MNKVIDLALLHNKVEEYNLTGNDVVLVSIWKDLKVLIRNEYVSKYSKYKNNDVDNLLDSATIRIIERLIKRRNKGNPYNRTHWLTTIYWEVKYAVYNHCQKQSDREEEYENQKM